MVCTQLSRFRESLFFRDTTDNLEHDAKSRLSIPVPSSEKFMTEIIRLKKLTLLIVHSPYSMAYEVPFTESLLI